MPTPTIQAYGPDVDPAHRVVSVRDNPVWRGPSGRPQLLWLEQVDESCQELLRMGKGDLPGGTLGFGVVGWETQRAPRRMLPLID